MIDTNWIAETTSTTADISVIVLTGAASGGFRPFSSAYSTGDELIYLIEDGDNKEIGFGTYDSTLPSIINRTPLHALNAGVYTTDPTAVALTLSGNAIVSFSTTARNLTQHFPMWKREQITLEPSGYNAPTFSAVSGTIRAWEFLKAPGAQEELGFLFSVPTNLASGGTVDIQLTSKVSTAAGPGETIAWRLEYAYINGSGTLTSSSSSDNVTAPVVLNGTCVADFPSITLRDNEVNTIIGKVYRDPTADSYAGSAHLLTLTAAYLSNKVGTPTKDGTFEIWNKV